MEEVVVSPAYGGDAYAIPADLTISVTVQTPNDALVKALSAGNDGSRRIVGIGDCQSPSTIAAAVYAGHRFGRTLGIAEEDIDFRRENVELAEDPSVVELSASVGLAG